MGKTEQENLEATLRERIDTLFERCAALCGFSIAERLVSEDTREGVREWELYVSTVATYPGSSPDELADEISDALAELCSLEPKAADLLPGRTFARAWH